MRGITCCILFILAVSCTSFHPAVAQAQDVNATTLNGTVEEVDWENSSLTIKYMVDDINIVYEQVHFSHIAKETKITKGDETIELDDLQVGDNVTVRYTGQEAAYSKLLTVVVEE